MKTIINKWYLLLCLALVVGIAACSDEFNEEEFIEKQAQLGEERAQADHQRALEIINIQLQNTLAAIEAQKNADIAVAEREAQLAQQLAELQAMMAEELERLKRSLQDAADSAAAAQYLAAYRAAGLLTQYTAVINVEDSPVAGLEVNLSSQDTTLTTDEAGVVIFQDVVVGTSTLNIKGDAIVDFVAVLRFDRDLSLIQQIRALGTSIPRSASTVWDLFSKVPDAEDVAIIQGEVSIETDLTNEGAEVPQDLVISADLSSLISRQRTTTTASTDNQEVTIVAVSFTEGDLGTATVDSTTGAYSLTVPVADNGSDVTLIIPEIRANQTIAISSRNDEEIDAELASVPAVYSLISGNADVVEGVGGYQWTINEPATPGTGFDMTFTKRGAQLASSQLSSSNLTDAEGQNFDYDNNMRLNYQITSQGSGYTSSPSLQIGDDVIGVGYIQGFLKSLTVVDQGENYGDRQSVTLQLMYEVGSTTQVVGSKVITSTSDGKLPGSISLDEGDFNFTEGNGRQFFDGIDGFEVNIIGIGTGGNLRPNVEMEVFGFEIFSGVADVVDTEFTEAPVMTFTGGGSTDQAVLNVEAYFAYDIEISNNGTGYSLFPNSINIAGRTFNSRRNNSDYLDQRVSYQNTVITDTGETLLRTFLELDGNGGIVRELDNYKIRTVQGNYFVDEPRLKIEDAIVEKWEVDIVIDDAEEGSLKVNVDNNGDGYDVPRSLTLVERIPNVGGTGFELTCRENFEDGEYEFIAVELINEGSGYKSNLNMDRVFPSGQTTIFGLLKGQTIINDIHYGTGVRLEKVGGDQ